MKKSLVIVAVISTFDVVTSFSNTASASTPTNVPVTEGAQRWEILLSGALEEDQNDRKS